jgi:23S rRNA pseudouridine2605 synthase
VLRDQLGERIPAEAGCDFTAPIVQREADEARASSPTRAEHKSRAERPLRADRKRPRHRQPPDHDGTKRPDRRGTKWPNHHEAKRPERGGTKRVRRRVRGEDTEVDFADKPQGRPRRGHAWRAEDAPLSRHYRGAGSKAHRPAAGGDGPKRTGLIADRKGRRVLVERFGDKAAKAPDEGRAGSLREAKGKPQRHGGKPRRGRPESRDRPRGAGPRPSRPKSR